ncbi:hypothetical protein PQX77_020288 [Marasmius sp. AFHP31]|nr:hypothetical protein PQX77_020288 [Marasmius sp. AFHP31]
MPLSCILEFDDDGTAPESSHSTLSTCPQPDRSSTSSANVVIDSMQANSGHARWPYKLFTEMYEGFARMESAIDPVGFHVAFPGNASTSGATKSRHLRYYLWAPANIVDSFKGTVRTWKEFMKTVENHFGGPKKVPSVEAFRKQLKATKKEEVIELE